MPFIHSSKTKIYKMQNKNKEYSLLYIKDRQISQFPIAEQTKRLRKRNKMKILQLGDKYLLIKDLFEQLNIKKDELYLFGKQLEEEYKAIKIGIHLQQQTKRMKESLYCWYAEFFFFEICQLNSTLLQRLVLYTNDPKVLSSYSKYQSNMISKIQKDGHSKKPKKRSFSQNPNIFTEIKANQEIDIFEYSNINTDNSNKQNSNLSPDSNIFDFNKFLNF